MNSLKFGCMFKCKVALCLGTFKCHVLDFTLLYLVPKESFPSFENFQMIVLLLGNVFKFKPWWQKNDSY